jgi:hypothetical protein
MKELIQLYRTKLQLGWCMDREEMDRYEDLIRLYQNRMFKRLEIGVKDDN